MSKLISLLPEDIRVVALQRQREEKVRYWGKTTDILGDAFNWESTPEEHIIWAEVNNDNYEPFREFHAKQKQQENNGWISVSERLPEVYTTCLVFNDSVEMCIYLPNNIWEGEDKNEKYNVTHWQPLPSPPPKN